MSADVLLKVASAVRLFHTSDSVAYADRLIEGHRETWPVRSKRFCAWLRQEYYERSWDAPPPSALSAALNMMEAQAQFDGPERQVSVRLAEHDGLVYLDLADQFWRSIDICAQGWRIIDDDPVRFRRPSGMLPLPLPARGGSIDDLRPFVNLPDPNDFVLVVAWLLAALRAKGPFPVLAISGEQGSAKTLLSKLLRALIDPGVAPVRALPREERDLFRCRPQRPRAGVRQSDQSVALGVGQPLPAGKRRRVCCSSTLHRSGRGSVFRRAAIDSQRHRGCDRPSRSCGPRPSHHP
jgi:hypothetical protein